MRRLLSSAVFGATVLVVLVVIVLTWRPWDDGAQARITASGLVPVLTLLLGQLGSWVITSASTEQAIAVRTTELAHDADQDVRRASRAEAAVEAERVRQEKFDVRLRFVEAISATSALAPTLANGVRRLEPSIPTEEFARAKVAVLTVSAYLDYEDYTYVTLNMGTRNLLSEMDGLSGARSEEAFATASGAVVAAITVFEDAVAHSTYLI